MKRPAANALRESITLARSQQLCWINDLQTVLSRLYLPVHLDISQDLEVDAVKIAMKSVEK
jgi:hypothetical protein